MKDFFFPISKKVMFRNYTFVTTENILKYYHGVYISMIMWYVFSSHGLHSKEKYVH